MNGKESFLRRVRTNAGAIAVAMNAVLGYAEDVVASQPGMAGRISRLQCLKRPGWARNDLDGAPHPNRDQVHIHLAHFRPRVRNPRLYQGDLGFPAVVTILIGFGYSVGLARETCL
jgi:hypothetical protein